MIDSRFCLFQRRVLPNRTGAGMPMSFSRAATADGRHGVDRHVTGREQPPQTLLIPGLYEQQIGGFVEHPPVCRELRRDVALDGADVRDDPLKLRNAVAVEHHEEQPVSSHRSTLRRMNLMVAVIFAVLAPDVAVVSWLIGRARIERVRRQFFVRTLVVKVEDEPVVAVAAMNIHRRAVLADVIADVVDRDFHVTSPWCFWTLSNHLYLRQEFVPLPRLCQSPGQFQSIVC